MKAMLTGGTGFLGEYLIEELAPLYETLFVITRSHSQHKHPKFNNVYYIAGDITHFEIVYDKTQLSMLCEEEIEVFIHAAALYDIKASYSDCFLQNVVGTQNIIHFVKNLKNIQMFYYVSTIAVADPECYFLEEDSLPKRDKFSDAYSETKYIAETIVRELGDQKFFTRIIRPAIIIGDSNGQKMPKIDGPYFFIEVIKKLKHLLEKTPFLPLPFNPKSKLPIIPVDHCARFMRLLIQRENSQQKIKCFHLVSHELPTIKVFLDDLKNELSLKTLFIPINRNKISDFALKYTGIPEEVIPFMFSRLSYDKSNILEMCPEIAESTYGTYKHILFGKK